MGKPHAEREAPVTCAGNADRETRHVITLPRPTLDQQQFLGQLQSAASNYDPNVLVCGKKLGE